jgi:hypothetical protein
MVAVVTIGFVKDAKHHIDVQGFNVYHKNRLIRVQYFLYFPYRFGRVKFTNLHCDAKTTTTTTPPFSPKLE